MYLFPLGKRILAIRAVSSGISGNFWGCRDIAFLLLLSTFLFTSYCSSPKYPSFSLSLSIPLANRVLNPARVAKRTSRSSRGNGSKFVQESTDLMGLQASLSGTAIQKALKIRQTEIKACSCPMALNSHEKRLHTNGS